MGGDEPFIRAMLAAPADAAPRLVYADWLDDHGDPRAAAFRQYPELPRLLAGLTTDAVATLNGLEGHATAGRVDLLTALADTLALPGVGKLVRSRTWVRVAESARQRVRRVLALAPGLGGADTLLGRPDRWEGDTAPELASMVAGGRPPADTIRLFERHAADARVTEFLACLAQELVIRGAAVAADPAVARLWARPREAGHPLATLPLALTSVESGLAAYLPRYSAVGEGQSMPFGPGEPPNDPLPGAGPARGPAVEDASDAAVAARIAAAVHGWTAGSNGRFEARVFRLGRRLAPGELSVDLLRALGLEALAGAEARDIRARRVTPGQAVDFLFSAAAGGGAYTAGRLGAYGRLAAWQSAAGLTGAADGDAVEEVAGRVRACEWVAVDPAAGWAYQVAWDFGLVAVRPDRRSLAVLMATDTD